MYNNALVAIAPGGRWFVSGEWGTTKRLLVFAMPQGPTRAASDRRTLPLASVITLARPMRDVQGCAFSSAVTLVCSTNDPGSDLYGAPRQLLAIGLVHALDGRPVSGDVRLPGLVPQHIGCPTPGETEGFDIYRSRLLLAVVSAGTTTAITYQCTLRVGPAGASGGLPVGTGAS
jgi:hypothetical protein